MLRILKSERHFVTFQSAILNQNCEQLTEISRFPIEGDMGLARLVNSDPPRIDMEKHNYEISNELANLLTIILWTQ